MRLVPIFLAALLLAGCAAPATPKGNETATSNVTSAAAAPLDDGSAPMSMDVGHMPHMHDYWKGRERVTLFDGDIDPSNNSDPFTNLEPLLIGKEAKAGRVVWNLPDGQLVFEGTGEMDLTATWSDPRVTSLAFEYQSDANSTFNQPAPLVKDKLTAIQVTPPMTDMPHMKTSRWLFGFEPADAPGLVMAPFHLKVEIVKMRDVEIFPGHPQLFDGKPEKLLEDGDHEHTEVSYAKRAPQLATDGDFSEKSISPTKSVPMETQSMRIVVDIIDATATPGSVTNVLLFYHGANTSQLNGHPTVLPIDGTFASKHMVWQIPVSMDETDSPYNEHSQWQFFVEPQTKFTGQDAEPSSGGTTDVTIKYHIKIVAFDHQLDAYSKHEGQQ